MKQQLRSEIDRSTVTPVVDTNTPEMIRLEEEIENRKKKLDTVDRDRLVDLIAEKQAELEKKERGVDVCFLVDSTFSMKPWLQFVSHFIYD